MRLRGKLESSARANTKETAMTKRLIPDGQCWCGCGAEVPLGKFFAPGHDRRAIQRVIVAEYGSAVQFLVRSGYAPGGAKWGKAS
jgi:hypothetical protein